jgi:N-acetylglucosamine malate deacetylase 1
MKNVLVVAPHPDDETLGCGGTLLKHKEANDRIHWLIVTGMTDQTVFSPDRIKSRQNEIKKVADRYGFSEVISLDLPTTKLDTIPMSDIVSLIGDSFQRIRPEIVYLPYRGDVHTDHKVVFDATVACTKWFRYPYVKKVLVYETLSETDFGLTPYTGSFRPNVFINIEKYLDRKIEIMKIFATEMGQFPFPRSEEAIRALAHVRGAASGCKAAEAFMLLREVQ